MLCDSRYVRRLCLRFTETESGLAAGGEGRGYCSWGRSVLQGDKSPAMDVLTVRSNVNAPHATISALNGAEGKLYVTWI